MRMRNVVSCLMLAAALVTLGAPALAIDKGTAELGAFGRVLHAFVVAPVTIAAIMSKSRRIVKTLFFGHPARLFVRVTFRIDILEGGRKRLAHSHRCS